MIRSIGARSLLAALLLILACSTVFADPSTVGFALIWAGNFMMGSADINANPDEKPAHSVSLSAFYLCEHEVTRGEWKAVMQDSAWPTPWLEDDGVTPRQDVGGVGSPEDDDYPASHISWDMAMAYCAIKNAGEGANWFRLPTEAEWEYAAKAGSDNPLEKYSDGITEDNLADFAWYYTNTTRAGEEWPHRTATKQANQWGLFDMQGNVEEWVLDWYGTYPSGSVSNPSGATTGVGRVMRGGSYQSRAYSEPGPDATSPNREMGAPVVAGPTLGFRVLRTINPFAYLPGQEPASGGGGSSSSSKSEDSGGGGGCFVATALAGAG